MISIISGILIAIGAFFMLVAGVGLVRMPDVYLRMSASTKAATLGVGCTLLAVAVYFGDFTTAIRALAIIFFLLITAPVAAHLLGRAAYKDSAPLWKGTVLDELEPYYQEAELVHLKDRQQHLTRELKPDHR